MSDARDTLLERLKTDLIGPQMPDEVIPDRPTDRYVTGILFAPKTGLSAEDDDEAAEADDADFTGTSLDGVKAASAFRPSSAGLSFAVRPHGERPALRLRIEGARYCAEEPEKSGEGAQYRAEEPQKSDEGERYRAEEPEKSDAGERYRAKDSDGARLGRNKNWRRKPLAAEVILDLETVRFGAVHPLNLGASGLPGASLHLRVAPWKDVLLVTLAVTNDAKAAEGKSRAANEEAALFQVSLAVECERDCELVPKPDRTGAASFDEDGKSSALLYRTVQQWAVGHTCSATWDEPVDGAIRQVRTSWFPEATVHVVSAAGDQDFHGDQVREPLNATWLASQHGTVLCKGLRTFVDAYAAWISRTEVQIGALPEELSAQGVLHMERCRKAESRMRKGIALLEESHEALDAFRMANAALALQYSWRVRSRSAQSFMAAFPAWLCAFSASSPLQSQPPPIAIRWICCGSRLVAARPRPTCCSPPSQFSCAACAPRAIQEARG